MAPRSVACSPVFLLLAALQQLSVSAAALFKLSVKLRADELTVGRVVIPTLARPDWKSQAEFKAARAEMFAQGLYPGVDYTIEARDDSELTVRPIYPLVEKLERQWPVSVDVSLAPRWMDPTTCTSPPGFEQKEWFGPHAL